MLCFHDAPAEKLTVAGDGNARAVLDRAVGVTDQRRPLRQLHQERLAGDLRCAGVQNGLIPVFVIRPFGFPIAATLAFALTARAFGSRRLLLDLGVGLILGIACWLLFSRLLGLALPGFPPLGVS